jgi:methylmalonyl-CoA mutase
LEFSRGHSSKAFYHKDELAKSFPIATKTTEFSICQNIFVLILKINRTSTRFLESWYSSLSFYNRNEIDVTNLLEKLPLEKVTVYFNLGFISIDFVKK